MSGNCNDCQHSHLKLNIFKIITKHITLLLKSLQDLLPNTTKQGVPWPEHLFQEFYHWNSDCYAEMETSFQPDISVVKIYYALHHILYLHSPVEKKKYFFVQTFQKVQAVKLQVQKKKHVSDFQFKINTELCSYINAEWSHFINNKCASLLNKIYCSKK